MIDIARLLIVATVFDADDGQGDPYFSPDRRRVLDRAERDRILGYLSGAPVAVPGGAFVPDPLEPARGAVVPAGYRTNGAWVWSDALAYYLDTYGVAPQRGLLARIEADGYRPPGQVPTERLAAAPRALAQSQPPGPDSPRRDLRYFVSITGGSTVAAPAGLYRRWSEEWPRRGTIERAESMGRDLRWHAGTAGSRTSGTAAGDDTGAGAAPPGLVPVTPRQASDVLDAWWRRWSPDTGAPHRTATGGADARTPGAETPGARTPGAETDGPDAGTPGAGETPTAEQLAVAAVFDTTRADGRPYFSPDRRRMVLVPEERDRILAYLTAAPLALRAHGLEPDPLDPDAAPAVPVGYRTDGVWVWQAAAALSLPKTLSALGRASITVLRPGPVCQ